MGFNVFWVVIFGAGFLLMPTLKSMLFSLTGGKRRFSLCGGGEGNEVLQEYTLLGQDTINYYSPDDFIEVSLEYDRAKHKIMY